LVVSELRHGYPLHFEQANLMALILIDKDEFTPTSRDVGAKVTDATGVDHHVLEDQLRQTESRLQSVLNNTRMAVFMMDERQHCSYMNAAAESLTGYSLAETAGRPLHDVIHHTHPDGSPFPISECQIDRAFLEKHHTQGECVFVHKDGSFYPVAFTASPLQDADGNPVGTIIEVRDIREEKERTFELNTLVNELNHRVKNTLTTVQAIVWQGLKGEGTPKETRDAISARLMALGRSHDLLTAAAWGPANINDVIARAVEPFTGNVSTSRFTLSGPEFKLPPKVVLALGMALHELATNALKYGALSTVQGRVTVAWDLSSDGGFSLWWEEVGGPPVAECTREGFGSRLLREGVRHELGATSRIAYLPAGLRYEIHFIMPAAPPPAWSLPRRLV